MTDPYPPQPVFGSESAPEPAPAPAPAEAPAAEPAPSPELPATSPDDIGGGSGDAPTAADIPEGTPGWLHRILSHLLG
jgi:hypothetical protein